MGSGDEDVDILGAPIQPGTLSKVTFTGSRD